MAAATVNHRFITVLGPIKMEILNLEVDATGDTFTSNLQRPLFGAAITNEDQNTNVAVSFSGRAGTLTGSGLGTDDAVVVLVFGF